MTLEEKLRQKRYAKLGIPVPVKPKESAPKVWTPEELYANDHEREMALAHGWDF